MTVETIKNRRKLEQSIRRHGIDFTVRRAGKNEFGEPDGKPKLVLSGRGLFHTGSAYVSLSEQEHGAVQTVQQPRLMLLLPVAAALRQNDLVELAGSRYRISGMQDLAVLGIALDVSLEAL